MLVWLGNWPDDEVVTVEGSKAAYMEKSKEDRTIQKGSECCQECKTDDEEDIFNRMLCRHHWNMCKVCEEQLVTSYSWIKFKTAPIVFKVSFDRSKFDRRRTQRHSHCVKVNSHTLVRTPSTNALLPGAFEWFITKHHGSVCPAM